MRLSIFNQETILWKRIICALCQKKIQEDHAPPASYNGRNLYGNWSIWVDDSSSHYSSAHAPPLYTHISLASATSCGFAAFEITWHCGCGVLKRATNRYRLHIRYTSIYEVLPSTSNTHMQGRRCGSDTCFRCADSVVKRSRVTTRFEVRSISNREH
jgi:hypothetical protein